MARRIAGCLVLVALAGMFAVGPAVAQSSSGGGLEVTTPPARPTPEFGLEPTMPLEQQGSRDQEFFPGLVRSRHEPAFVKPFVGNVPVSTSSSIRLGLSGWTSPALPADTRNEAAGGAAFGLSILWGRPNPEATPSGPESLR
jgi:hypothetical protein